MLHLDVLTAKPAAFVSLTGMTPAAFADLYAAFVPVYERHRAAATHTRRDRRPRRRAPGAGGPYAHDLRHRLLLALVWLKVYPTYEILGLLFGLHKRNAQLNVRAILEVLELLDAFPFDRPDHAGRPRLGSLTAVMAAFPAVRLVIDAKEQRVYRPGGDPIRQKPFYSGKKKAHTLKTQFAVTPDGLIVAVSHSAPGAMNDVALLRESGLLDRLPPGMAVMLDKGYEGAGKGYPTVRLILPQKDRKARPLTEDDRARNQVIGRYRVVVEHALAQVNRFTVLRQVYRGAVLRHGQVVRAVVALVNRRIRVKPLKVYPRAA